MRNFGSTDMVIMDSPLNFVCIDVAFCFGPLIFTFNMFVKAYSCENRNLTFESHI